MVGVWSEPRGPPRRTSVEAGLEVRGHQRDMRLERRAQLEGLRPGREIPEPQEAPVAAALLDYRELVAGDVEGGSLPAPGRLDFDQPGAPVALEARDVVARAVAILIGHPAHPAREIFSAARSWASTRAGPAKGAVPLVPPCHGDLAVDVQHLLQLLEWRLVVGGGPIHRCAAALPCTRLVRLRARCSARSSPAPASGPSQLR